MSISEITASDACGGEYEEGFIDEKESAIGELNGCEREFTVLHRSKSHKSQKYLDALQENNQHLSLLKTRSEIYKPFATSIIRPMKAGGKVEGSVIFEWGGEEGPSWSGGVSAEAHDDKGNYAKVEVKKDSDGKASVGVYGGYDKEEGSE